MSEEEKVVTHEDIWDDSALVNSWNEALEEYKVSRIAAVLLLASISCALSRTTCLPVAEKKKKKKEVGLRCFPTFFLLLLSSVSWGRSEWLSVLHLYFSF